MRYLLFLFLFFCLSRCQNDPTQSGTGAPDLIVRMDSASLREGPGEKSRELRALPLGERLSDLGEVSVFITPIRFGDTLLEAPWIKVQTADKQSGWVFAAALKPGKKDLAEWFLQKQMRCFFGQALTNRRNAYASQTPKAEDQNWLAWYREGIYLRDTLMSILANRTEANEGGFRPDYFWLRNVLPGFVFQRVGEESRPYLFFNYALAYPMAKGPQSLQTAAFFKVAFLAFPYDSIESFSPAWKLPIPHQETVSLLGAGKHVKILQAIDQTLQAGKLFEPELLVFKDAVLEDILGKNTLYWQAQDKILAELQQIVNAGFSCLNERDRLALQERLKLFGQPELYGIRVNLRSGE